MIEFALPDPLPDSPPETLPPPLPENPWHDELRIEQTRNRFLAKQQEVLHTAPDAFLNRQGWDAVDGAHGAVSRLQTAHDNLIAEASTPAHQTRLRDALAPTLTHATDRVVRHAAEQSFVGEKQTAQHRLDLLAKQAAHDHADPHLIDAYADSALTTMPDRTDAAAARSSIYRSAIEAAFAAGNTDIAHTFYDRTRSHLVPEDVALLDPLIDYSRQHQAGRNYFQKLSTDTPASATLTEADAAHEAASAQNAADWAHDPTQQATNQHIIDVQFGKQKRGISRPTPNSARLSATGSPTPTPTASPRPSARRRLCGSSSRRRNNAQPISSWHKTHAERPTSAGAVLRRT